MVAKAPHDLQWERETRLDTENLISKTHPLDRDATPDDPFELVASPVVGDPDVMLECILQEFLWMGWGTGQLLALFHHPGYPLLADLREHFGEDEVHRRIEALVMRGGRLQVSEVIDDSETYSEDEPELVQLTWDEPTNEKG